MVVSHCGVKEKKEKIDYDKEVFIHAIVLTILL